MRVWDPLTGEPLGPALEHGAAVSGVSFNRAGDAVLVFGGGRTTLWRLPIANVSAERLQELAQLACGCRLDETGGLEPIHSDELVALLMRLRLR